MEDHFAHLRPLAGGHSGQTFLADAGGERSVVRIYAEPGERGEQAHEVDAALLRLVRGLLPVPEVLEVRRADPGLGTPALLVTSYVPGERGDLVLPDLDDDGLAALGREVGRLAATLGGMPQLRTGPFVDGDLRVGSWPFDGLPAWWERCRPSVPDWTAQEYAALGRVVDTAQDLLDTVDRQCLVHGDLNPKNLLVDPETLQITGLVDWEHAHAGHPFTDLGNVLRFDRQPAYRDAVLGEYAAVRGTPPEEALALARAADLPALIELATRPDSSPVAAAAWRRLRGIAVSGDTDGDTSGAPDQ